jgi:hypothetical protein
MKKSIIYTKINKVHIARNMSIESKLNKKGYSMISESDKILFWFVIFLVLALCVIFIVAWTNSLKGMYLNDALQPAAYEARLIYSDKCFAYKDDTGRVYSGTIDLSKFNAEVFYGCLPLSTADEHALAVILTAQDGTALTLKSSNWNINTAQIVQNNYIVQVVGANGVTSPGLLTFSHKTGN